MKTEVGMLLPKSTDTRGVGISSMRKSIYRAAKNSDFVRVIGFFNPPLRVRTDIYAINDLFGLWTRYKIGINLNYSDTFIKFIKFILRDQHGIAQIKIQHEMHK